MKLTMFKATCALVVAVVVMTPTAQALCPGETPCSGHGTCGASDKCTCYATWDYVADCSLQKCIYGQSWADGATGSHEYLECSGRGTCDRKLGLCECQEGFSGSSCQRLDCHEGCNGHGVCKTLSEIDTTYVAWDKDSMQACVCDPGWIGTSCFERQCKTGDDPLTTGQDNAVQELQIYGTGSSLGGDFTVSYTDWRGNVWTTYPITSTTATPITVKEALQALPNGVVDEVTVTQSSTASADSLAFQVTFSGPGVAGPQTLMSIGYTSCVTSGCQPYLSGLTSNGVIQTTVLQTGTEENAECSNRGNCNKETGLCECYGGYTGDACGTQTVIT